MNNIQKAVLISYCILIVAIVAYPPFHLIVQGHLVRSEYSWIWKPIMYGTEYEKTILGAVDATRVILQMAGASLVAVALVFLFREKTI